MESYYSILEALLFVAGENLPVRKIAEIIELDIPETRKILITLQKKYEIEQRGIRLIEVNHGFQMTTIPEHSVYIEKLCKQSKTKGLSPATVEVLAIIAYKQPITRGEIENIRGVSCDRALRILNDRELIHVKERSGGKGFLYTTSEGFLRCFGLKNLKDLPTIDSFQQLTMDEFNNE